MHSIALPAVSCLRSIAGFGFPLFAPAMYAKLGYGKGDTVLACLAVGLGCPACVLSLSFLVVYPDYSFTSLIFIFSPFLLWKYGKRIRMSSTYAHKAQTLGGSGASASNRGNDVAVGAGANDSEKKKSNADEEKERNRHRGPSLQGSLRVHCLMQRLLWIGQGDSIPRSDLEGTKVVGKMQGRRGER